MYALRAARCFDGEATVAGGVTVLVDAGRIAGVEPGHPEIGADWQVLDYPGATIMPGLADAHVHLGGDSADGALDRLADYPDDRLVAGGLPASKALASATSMAAGACGFGDRKGRVRPGFDADLLVVAGDPAADIGMLAQVKSVMVQGSMVSGPG